MPEDREGQVAEEPLREPFLVPPGKEQNQQNRVRGRANQGNQCVYLGWVHLLIVTLATGEGKEEREEE